ncbi:MULTISPECIES: redoxin domain-containing protein [Myxococcus]|uniref:Redoxin domain-containing protein n=1 Tax=Myxococcus llanfairpwllgwyngyllgogerychwyrndrobwllllantysiliogogogochensis TaxID=2590453 RepID=A0A540XA44_9BACT|nr:MULTISPECIES: redoxin domain-containing protein [Myxococcus]NTX08742.1 redoxin domain-containing protein [Myxococcus sp. CA040A]TQF17544.1 redoxin domain-containing protein [Myxococcus llanfairpwllgwyngyllgogerychwyrndrobwllllantysiliogogogochensis]
MAFSARQSTAPLPLGTLAPPIRAPVTPDQKVSLEEFRGAPLVLVFYPADWSPVCSDELALFNELMPEFERLGAKVVAISCDGVWCHLAFARARNLHMVLASDFHPKGEISRAYHAYREEDGISERALFVIDAEGKIFWSYVSPVAVNPGADGVLDALERLAEQGTAEDDGGPSLSQREESTEQEARP